VREKDRKGEREREVERDRGSDRDQLIDINHRMKRSRDHSPAPLLPYRMAPILFSSADLGSCLSGLWSLDSGFLIFFVSSELTLSGI
jgi:hypothetical protein